MPRKPQSKYFWPASAMTASDMDLLYRARESASRRVPITQLLARAVRQTYGHMAGTSAKTPNPGEERMVA